MRLDFAKLKQRSLAYIIVLAIIILLSILPFFIDVKNFASPTFIRNLLINAGAFGYGLLILLILASVPLPIPSSPVILGGGYVYGTIVGSIVSLIGIVIGASISFLLVRRLGRPILEKLVDKHHIIHFNHIFKKRGAVAALISYAVPVFPSDAISGILGLTRMNYGTFLLLVVIGHIPRVLLINSLGQNLYSGLTTSTIVILVATLLLVLIAAFREKLKKFFFKELHQLEKGAKVVEKELEKDAKLVEIEVEGEAKFVEEEVEKDARIVEKGIEKEAKVLKKGAKKVRKTIKKDIKKAERKIGIK